MKRVCPLLRIILIILCCIAIAAGLLIWDGLNDDVARADIALVLGNTVNPDGSLSGRLQARLDEALRMYRAGYFPLIMVSGGIGREGRNEAEAMRLYLADSGVPCEGIIVDSAGVDTYTSARNLKAVMAERNLHSAFVVTQYFHITRTRLALRRFGISPVYSSHARYFEPRDIVAILRELAGYVSYTLRSYD